MERRRLLVGALLGLVIVAVIASILSAAATTATPDAVGSGDVDCDGDVDAVDALKILRHIAVLSVSQTEPCPDIGSPVDSAICGDVDCDGDVDAVDALQVFRYVAGLSVSQAPGCPPIGPAALHPDFGDFVVHAQLGDPTTGCALCHTQPIPFTTCSNCHVTGGVADPPPDPIGNAINFPHHTDAGVIAQHPCSECHAAAGNDARFVDVPAAWGGPHDNFCNTCHTLEHSSP